jgi:hypothetical protein
MNGEQMDRVKIMADNASIILWVTAGDLLGGKSPNFAHVQGLSRALMMGQPSLRFLTFDVDNIQRRTNRTTGNIASVLKRSADGLHDYEYIERDGVVHTRRFIPDHQLNDFFRQKQGAESIGLPISVAKPAQISIKNPGQFDTIYFKQIKLPETLRAGEVQVEVKVIGLNAKDFYALGGKVDTKESSCTLEYSGIVERVRPNVSSVTPGGRVVVMAPSYFKTSEIVPEWVCHKLQDEEDLNVVCTLPVVYATALYALHTKANIQPGESILIHSGAGGVGIAAIQLAQ